jgi:glycosyltransferase involved in cell wall biosynthesis
MVSSAQVLDLSVVIPCYNEEPHLEDSTRKLLEVLDQTRYSYEIIFVEDCSKDATREVVLRVCATYPHCRYILHDKNRGRGAAFKTGFVASFGRIVGFIDIDLEVSANYITGLVNQIEHHGVDVATGYRHYLLSQTGGIHRHVLSVAYRALIKLLLDAGVRDTETGLKFFRRETATDAVLQSECDGWFWDTEVMVRSALAGLRIVELPVLFLRRYDKQSTVRVLPDTLQYFRELMRFRPKVGLGLVGMSPVYWTGSGYDLLMRVLYGQHYESVYRRLAEQVAPGSSVIDVCCGTAGAYRYGLAERGCSYVGLDFNGHMVMANRKRGIASRSFNLLTDPIPEADYVVMGSSFYHVRSQAAAVLARMQRAARKAVVLSEPVSNLSTLPGPAGRLMSALSNPGVGEYSARYDLESLRAFAEEQGALEFLHEPGDRNAVLVFPGTAAGEASASSN